MTRGPPDKSRRVAVPLLGAHMSISGGPVQALERGRSIGCAAIQIFVKNNMQWFARPFTGEAVRAFRDFPEKASVVFGHASYLINPAANDPEFLEKSRRALAEELIRAEQLKLPFLVLHPGAHMGDGLAKGVKRVIETLDMVFRVLSQRKCKIALEITAGQGSSIGHRLEHLAEIIAGSRYPDRLMVCLDTAHLFAAGYDISSPDRFRQTMHEFDKIIGRSRLAAWHLNDSKAGLGSHVDRHEHIGKGKIGLAAFREIMRANEFAIVPKVLETPKAPDLADDVRNLEVLRGLLADV
jgi:deoxyribonuclease IV